MAMYGATIGKLGILGMCAATNQACAALLPDGPTRELIPYLFYFLLSERGNFRNFGQGGAQPNISQTIIKSHPFRVAPLAEQHRIVAAIEDHFSRLDEAVTLLERVQRNLKRYRASVLKAAVEGRLVPTEAELARAEGRDYEPASVLLQRILAERRRRWEKSDRHANNHANNEEPAPPDTSNLPDLPEGWSWATVDQLSVVVRGASPRPAGDPRLFGGNIPWITVGDLTKDESAYLRVVPGSVTEAGRLASRYVEPETLLLTNSGATLGVPKITLIGGCINDGSVALLGLGYPLKLYLLYYLHYQTKTLRGINQGAAQPNLNTSIVKAIRVPVPPEAEQIRIVAEVLRQLEGAQSAKSIIDCNRRRCSHFRQSILKWAFAGKLADQDPTDEPASVLLERIHAEKAKAQAVANNPRRVKRAKRKEP
jgi:type I restriction enzyme S subunit